MDQRKKKRFEWGNKPKTGDEQKAVPAPVPAPVPAHIPAPVHAHAPASAVQPKKGVVAVSSLRIRKDHNTKSEMVAGLVAGDEVTLPSR